MLNVCGIVVAILKMATGRNLWSPLEEQFSKWLPKHGIKNGR
jgi:hypothetical protein